MHDVSALRAQAEAEIEAYIRSRREGIDAFVSRRFSLPAVAGAQRRAIQYDLLRLTANLALALPSLVVRRAAGFADKLGFSGLTKLLDKIPLPLTTVYERQTQAALLRELFGLDDQSPSPLLAAITANPTLAAASVADDHDELGFLRSDTWLREEVERCVRGWGVARGQVRESFGSLAVLSTSYLFFNSGGHGPLEVGRKLAATRARQQAAGEFFLGETIGNVFYSIAPVKPTALEVIVATALTLLLLAGMTLLVNVVADPLQRQFGTHHRQLSGVIDQLEERLYLALRRRLRPGGQQRPTQESLTDTLGGIMDRMSASSRAAFDTATDRATDYAGIAATYVKRGTVGVLAKLLAAATVIKRALQRRKLLLASRYGRRTVNAALTVLVLALGGGLYATHRALQFDPYEEADELIAEHAYATALTRIDAMQRQKQFKSDPRLLAMRAQALCGSGAFDACAETYGKLMERDPAVRQDSQAVLTLATAVANTGHSGARKLLVQQVGPLARSLLADLALEKRPVDRWALADTLKDLGATDLPVADYIHLELSLARSCDEKKRAIEKLAPRKLSEAAAPLREVLADPALKCAHTTAKAALAKIALPGK